MRQIEDLRNQGGQILERVAGGETLMVTRDGRPIAQLQPLPSRPIPATLLLQRWRRLPYVDPDRLRPDIAYACNPADFAGIDGLTVVAVPIPERR